MDWLKQNWFKLSILAVSTVFSVFYFMHQEKLRHDEIKKFCEEKIKVPSGITRSLEISKCINSFK